MKFESDVNKKACKSSPILIMTIFVILATSEGSIAMMDGEELLVIEVDQGDGWTRVRRPADSIEGFVPTSYISCILNNC